MRGILLLIALAGLATFSCAIPYVYDELLYTKQLWDEYKLDFPYSIVFKEDDEVISRAKDSLAGLFIEDILSGPQSNLQELIDQDLKRGEFQPNSFDVSLIEDSTPLTGAASVAQCKTCLALASVMWDGLVQWTHRYMGSVAAHDLIPYGESLCEYEVPEAVLKEWVLLSARVHSSPEHPAQQFYMLSVRHRQHARVREIQVVRAACKALLSDKHADALEEGRDVTTDDIFRMEASPLLEIIAKRQKEYLEALTQRGAIPLEKTESNTSINTSDGGSTSGNSPEDRIPALDDDIDNLDNKIDDNTRPSAPLPKVQRECFNKHPQCEYWAERGECKANPGYMVGTETNGWCRAACFVCPHPQPVSPGGSLAAIDVAALEQISADLLDFISTTGCTKSSPCRFINGNAAAKSRLAAAAGVDPDRTAALQKVSLISGPIEAESGANAPGSASGSDGNTNTAAGRGVSGVHQHLFDESMVVTILPIDKAVVPKSKDDIIQEKILKNAPEGKERKNTGGGGGAVERALWAELGGQCMYTNGGWWSYEVCYLHSTTQFHMPGGQNGPDWVISLGNFHSADWEIRNVTSSSTESGKVAVGFSLFPAGSVIPYVSQHLESGNVCELTGENGVNSLESTSGGGEDEGIDVENSVDISSDKKQQGASAAGAGAPGTVGENTDAGTSTSSSKNKKLKVGDQVLRSTLIRFMCSPDLNKHIAVVEPEQCRYVVDVYVPVLCRIHGMAPVIAPPPILPSDAINTESSTKTHRMDEDFDDPYMDPDELEELELRKKEKKESKGQRQKDEL